MPVGLVAHDQRASWSGSSARRGRRRRGRPPPPGAWPSRCCAARRSGPSARPAPPPACPARPPGSGLHDRAVAGRAVQRHLDGSTLGVVGRLADELLDRGRERVVRVVDEHVAAPRMTANRLRSLLGASASRGWVTGTHGSSFRSGRSSRCSAHRPLRSSGRAVERDVVLGRGRARARAARAPRSDIAGFDLEAHGPAEAAAAQLHLDRGEQVVGLLLLEGEVGVAGDPERPVVARSPCPGTARRGGRRSPAPAGRTARRRAARRTGAAAAAPSPGRSALGGCRGRGPTTARFSDRFEM